MVDADDLVVGTGSEVAAVGRESNGVDSSEMVAHMAELPGFRVVSVMGVEDGLDGPDADMAISAGGGQPLAVGRDVAAVNFKVLLFA